MKFSPARFLPWLLLVVWFSAAADMLGEVPPLPSRTVPMPEGLTARLKIPEIAVMGEHIEGEFVVTNTGKTPVTVFVGAGTGAKLNSHLQVHVWSERAKLLPDLVGQPRIAPFSQLNMRTLGAGESLSIPCPLEAYVAILQPGMYTVTVAHDLGWLVDERHPPLMASVNIGFKPPTAKLLAARVHDLCEKPSDEKKWELMHLWSPFFLPALRDESQAGRVEACLGLGSLMTAEANDVLFKLAQSKDPAMAGAAGYALSTRLPSLLDPERPALRSWNGNAAREQILHTWEPRFEMLFTSTVPKLLDAREKTSPPKARLEDPDALPAGWTDPVSAGARLVEARGTADQAPLVLAALERALDAETKPRKTFPTTVAPAPADALIRALSALRARGWRVDDSHDDLATTLARLREFADPKVGKPADDSWQKIVRAGLASKSPIVRENAVYDLPRPLSDDWAPLLRTALEDEDGGVLCIAAKAAADSGRKEFAPLLVKILQREKAADVQSAAMRAAERLGAGGLEFWQAVCDLLPDRQLGANALQILMNGTIERPKKGFLMMQYQGTPERMTALREAWKAFLLTHHDALESGQQIPADDPSIASTPALGLRFASDP